MTTLSDAAFKLWRLLTERPYDQTIDELVRELGVSKTAINRAIAELEEARLVSVDWEPREEDV